MHVCKFSPKYEKMLLNNLTCAYNVALDKNTFWDILSIFSISLLYRVEMIEKYPISHLKSLTIWTMFQ